jgi:hypothetical protein
VAGRGGATGDAAGGRAGEGIDDEHRDDEEVEQGATPAVASAEWFVDAYAGWSMTERADVDVSGF